ncbi:hypothetical protein [Nocardiopsis quinghaiensis]|uniref:hypothetical protein n=1 Tax=Nocardiopsis quinghaiensis TaxID=464995 RepID=UPI0029589E3D|nr:hypothetical protein [Nocardiopsis quinghaiensis]
MTATRTALVALAAGTALTLTATACGGDASGDPAGNGLTPVTVGVLPITAVAPSTSASNRACSRSRAWT